MREQIDFVNLCIQVSVQKALNHHHLQSLLLAFCCHFGHISFIKEISKIICICFSFPWVHLRYDWSNSDWNTYIRNLKPTKFEPLWLWPSFIDPQRCISYLMPSECVHCSAWKRQLSPSHLLLSSSKSVLWPFGPLRIRHHLILMLWFAGFVCVCLLMLMSVSVFTNKQGKITAVFLQFRIIWVKCLLIDYKMKNKHTTLYC